MIRALHLCLDSEVLTVLIASSRPPAEAGAEKMIPVRNPPDRLPEYLGNAGKARLFR